MIEVYKLTIDRHDKESNPVTKSFHRFLSGLLILALALALIPVQFSVTAAPSELFFSEYIEGQQQQQSPRNLQWHRRGR